MNESLCAVITAWLNAFCRHRVGIGVNRSAGGKCSSVLSGSSDWVLALYKNLTLL